jgi:hypothetical protein
MSAQRNATFAAIAAMAGRLSGLGLRRLVGVFVIAVGLSGCMPVTVPLAGADPANPAARVAAVKYRSTTEPYLRLRPAEPAPWLDQNKRVTPAPKSDQ